MAITTRELTLVDAEGIAALMARIEADHPTGFSLGAPEIVELMTDKPGTTFEGAFDGQDLVAYTTVITSVAETEGQKFFLFGDVDPARLGEGIGSEMLGRALERARTIHARHTPDAPARYSCTALAGRDDQTDLMRSAGLQPGRHSFLMVADLAELPPASPLPGGLEVTAFDPAVAEEVRLVRNKSFADNPEGIEIGAEFWALFMVTAQHNRPELAAVARDETGAVVAYVLAHEYTVPPSGGSGREVHVPSVGTLPAHRGRGLATGLLARVLHTAREHGYATASLNVDTHNPTGALGIYERAGFCRAYRHDSYHLDE